MASCLDIQKKPMNWLWCCLCQINTSERNVSPKHEGYCSLDSDLRTLENLGAVPSTFVNIKHLDEGPGIAITLHSNKAVYHKSCRNKCDKQKIKRVKQNHPDLVDDNLFNSSPKKLRSSDTSMTDGNSKENLCMICMEGGGELHTVQFTRVDQNLKDWSKATKKFLLHARIVTIAADAPAGEVQYHLNCYTDLRYEADKAKKPFPDKTKQDVYDPLVIAQLIIYMTESKEVFKLARLKFLYKQKLAELGRPCENDINSTRFKEHLLDNLPGWTAVQEGNGKPIF